MKVGLAAEPGTYRVEVEAEGDVLGLVYQTTADHVVCVAPCERAGERIEIRDGFRDATHVTAHVRLRAQDRGPSAATVRLYRDNAVIAEGDFTPRYEIEEPNGPGCGEHVFATAALDAP